MLTLQYYRAVHRGIQLFAEHERRGWGRTSAYVSQMLADAEHLAAIGVVRGRGNLSREAECQLAGVALAGFRNDRSGGIAYLQHCFGAHAARSEQCLADLFDGKVSFHRFRQGLVNLAGFREDLVNPTSSFNLYFAPKADLLRYSARNRAEKFKILSNALVTRSINRSSLKKEA